MNTIGPHGQRHIGRRIQQQPRIVASAARQRLFGQLGILRRIQCLGAQLHQTNTRFETTFQTRNKFAKRFST